MSSSSLHLSDSTIATGQAEVRRQMTPQQAHYQQVQQRQSRQQAQQHQQAQQGEADGQGDASEKDSFFTRTTARMSAAWFTSMVFHLMLLVGLALYTLTQLVVDEPIALAMNASAEEPEAMLEMPLEIEDFDEEDPLEEQLTEDAFDESLLQTDVIADLPIESVVAETADFGNFSSELVELSGGGKGDGDEGFGLKSASKFFKSGGGPPPKTIVYVVDNSNSMTGKNPGKGGYGRMETALVELAKSVNSLQPEQSYYIILYSDTAYGLYHPTPSPGYVKANTQNKYLTQEWLKTVQCCLYTEGGLAFEMARQLNPELIYLLGDGGFTDNAHKKIIANPIKGTRIEALGMNLSGGGKKSFQDIAKAHGGSYRDVSLTEDGKAILRQFGPRRANGKNGPVWGRYIDQVRKAKQLGKKKKKKK